MGFGIDTSSAAFLELMEDARAYLRDQDGSNTLYCDSTENSFGNLVIAAKMGISSFNSIQPISHYTLETIPPGAYHFLICETVVWALVSAGIFQTRNRLDYSSGGLTISDHNKGPGYQGWAQALMHALQTRANAEAWKITGNISGAYGNFNSEYYYYGYRRY